MRARFARVGDVGAVLVAVLCVGCGGRGKGVDRETAGEKFPPLRAAAPQRCSTFARRAHSTYDLCRETSLTTEDHGSFVVRSGSTSRRPAIRTPTAPPPGTPLVGEWRRAALSPDGRTLLATWSAECEVPVAFFIPLATGIPRPVGGEKRWGDAPESVGVRWLSSTRAVVDLPKGACGNRPKRPGRYAVTLAGRMIALR